MSSATPLIALLPVVDAASVRLRRLAGLARLCMPQWAEALGYEPGSIADLVDAPLLRLDSLKGRLWLRLGMGFEALHACRRLPDAAQRDAVATLLAADTLTRWLPGLGPCHAFFDAPAGGAALSAADRAGIAVHLPEGEALVVAADAPLLDALQTLIERQPPSLPTLLARCGALRLSGQVLIDRRPVTCSALARLRTGDVLLTRRSCVAAPGARVALSGRSLWRGSTPLHRTASACMGRNTLHAWAQVDANRMTLDAPFDWDHEPFDNATAQPATADTAPASDEALPSGMTGLSPAGGVGPEPAAPAPGRRIPVARLDQIELPLELTLPAPTLSLVELAALAPGDVVTLPLSTADASVRLSVNGQTLGLGELVAVGSQLGVRIVRLAGAFGAPPDAIAGEAP